MNRLIKIELLESRETIERGVVWCVSKKKKKSQLHFIQTQIDEFLPVDSNNRNNKDCNSIRVSFYSDEMCEMI